MNAGVYLFTTSDTTNYPDFAGRTDNWARLEVSTSSANSAEVLQRIIWNSDGVEFTRLYASGKTWTDWSIVVSGAVAHLQFFKSIPSGADLNDYMTNGTFVSQSYQNVISNLPPYFGDGKGAFTLIVTGINANSTYTNQILIALDNAHIYMRSQTSWQEPWVWTDWYPILVEQTNNQNSGRTEIHLNIGKQSLEPNLYFDRNVNGYKYTRLYEANTSDGELAIAQRTASNNSVEAITRLNWNGDHVTLRQDGSKLWLGDSTAPMARFYTADYGTSLPTNHSKGRVFFLKV